VKSVTRDDTGSYGTLSGTPYERGEFGPARGCTKFLLFVPLIRQEDMRHTTSHAPAPAALTRYVR